MDKLVAKFVKWTREHWNTTGYVFQSFGDDMSTGLIMVIIS